MRQLRLAEGQADEEEVMDTIDRVLLGITLLCMIGLLFIVNVRVAHIERIMVESEQEFERQTQVESDLHKQRHQRITQFLTAKQGRYPKIVADACMQTSDPALCAAIALAESTANPYCLPGDHGRSRGGWQVQPKWWGKVSADPYRQAKQAEWVFKTLVMRYNGSTINALRAYNGDGDLDNPRSARYAATVLANAGRMR